HYVKAFPETLHHPKEEVYLFRKLRERTHELDAALDELEHQHADNRALVVELETAIAAYEAEPARGFLRFTEAVERFVASQIQHMLLETKVILPAAGRHLKADDWAALAAAFGGNDDPRLTAADDEAFKELFARI